MIKKPLALIFSCEHAVNTIPNHYAHYFKEHQNLLNTHRAVDFGAGPIAVFLSQSFLPSSLFMTTISRLLIDCNRSLHHVDCFSEISLHFKAEEKEELVKNYYKPYREQLKKSVASYIAQEYQVLHLSIHSFTPILNGVVRNAELGLLYDPKRRFEKKFVQQWQRRLIHQGQGWRTRLNYPYKGYENGFTTSLRKVFKEEDYLGIEVESNQALTKESSILTKLITLLSVTLKKTINSQHALT